MGRRSALDTRQPPPPPFEPEGDAVDLSRIVEPDVVCVELLARATLEARRRGETLSWHGASPQLQWLVRPCGLEEVLRLEQETDPKS
jgi:hypothetical protein